MSFADFPVEIVYLIFTEAVLEGDKLIVQADRLLQNGQARDNLVLPRLLNLSNNLSRFAEELLWRRIGLCRLNTLEPIPIDYFTTLSKLYQSKKQHTKSINIALEFAQYELDGPEPGEVMKIASEIFRASRLSSINEVVLWITIPDLPENTVEFWYHIHPILRSTTEFRNLTRFEFSFSQKASLGNSLSSLSRLNSISLEGLKSPNPKWTKLNWKSNIKKLSLTKCESFEDFPSLKTFFQLFHKSLIALRFDVEEIESRPLEDCGILKSFESLQQLTIYQNHHRNISIVQQFSICPSIKSIHWIVSDPHPSNEQIRSLIFDLLILKNYQNRWNRLRSLILPSNFANSFNNPTYEILDKLDILCHNYSVKLSYLDDNEYDMRKHLKFYI